MHTVSFPLLLSLSFHALPSLGMTFSFSPIPPLPSFPLSLPATHTSTATLSTTSTTTASANSSTSTPSTELQIEAIEAHFANAQLVPELLTTFTPSALFGVSFDGESITPGQAIIQSQVQTPPTLTITPANSTSALTLPSKITLIMVDAGAVGTNETSQVRQWLVNDIPLNKSELASASAQEKGVLLSVNATTAKVGTAYSAPMPAMGNGTHRYAVLVYAQPNNFSVPAANLSGVVGDFDLESYVKMAGLGSVIAGNYFTVTNGSATMTVAPTFAAATSTLPAAQSVSTSAE